MAMLSLAALLALTGVPPQGSTARPLSTPPLPPGVVCGRMQRRDLGAVPLTSQTTYAEVVAAWGAPGRDGPAGEVAAYYLTCDARLWLSFEPSGQRRLTRAILFTGSFVPQSMVILDTLDITRRRRCDQLRRGRYNPAHRIVEAWGPPDNAIGSGIVRWTYGMADGGFAQVFPDRPGRFLVTCAPGRAAD